MHVTLVRRRSTVLQRDGAAALTVRNITAEAGCSTTGIYTYFGGKHGLVEAIFVEGFESFDRPPDRAVQGRRPARGRAARTASGRSPTRPSTW